jgi:hypothetical protein
MKLGVGLFLFLVKVNEMDKPLVRLRKTEKRLKQIKSEMKEKILPLTPQK